MSVRPPIAIVGMGAMFPGSTSTHGFWRDILEGHERLTDIPAGHFAVDDYYAAEPGAPDKIYARRGGFLSDVPFPALDLGVPPNQLPSTDTAQLLAVMVAKQVLDEALRDRADTAPRDRISVVLGVGSALELAAHMSRRLDIPLTVRALRQNGVDEGQVVRVRETLEAAYVPWQESTFPGLLANVVSGRVANRLDLGGSNFVVDAACAASLAAVRVALDELALGDSDLVITGGVDALNDILMFMCFSQTGALSASGRCRPLDIDADGTMLAEGVGMVALKRLDDAERDGDRVYAVIRGIGSSSDGRAKSIYAPRPEGQALALRRAYEHAGYAPATVELVEAHGTATRAGDAAELASLRAVFDEAAVGSVVVGSVKSQIGHAKSAAGIGGLIKVALALHHRTLPPTIGVTTPNPALELGTGPFRILTEPAPWVRGAGHPRRGSVSSFGFGGTNFHVALEAYTGPNPAAKLRTGRAELVLIGAASGAEVAAAARALAASARDLPFEARRSQRSFDPSAAVRLAVVASSLEELVTRLGKAAERAPAGAAFSLPTGVHVDLGPPGQVAALFPGQGSQYVGMGGALARLSDAAGALWDRAADVDGSAALVFPGASFTDPDRQAADARLRATEAAQPAIVTASLAAWAALREHGFVADAVAGHSLGELAALAAAGAVSEVDAVALAAVRGAQMAAAADVPGAMLAVTGTLADVRAWIAPFDGVVVANHNAPRQVVVSGPTAGIEAAEAAMLRAGVTAKRLPVSTAFHSPLVAGAVSGFRAALAAVEVRVAAVPVASNADGGAFPTEADALRDRLAGQIVAPVCFVEGIEAMWAAGVRTFVEVGPDAVLTRLVGAILEGRPHRAVAVDQRGRDGLVAWTEALGRLAVAGVRLDFDAAWRGWAEPIDPASIPAPKLTLPIRGSNYGKPAPVDPTPRFAPLPAPVVAAVPAVPAAPIAAPTPTGLDALTALQAPILAAQLDYQRVLAESHLQFLKTIEATYAALGLAAPAGIPAVAVLPVAAALLAAPARPVGPVAPPAALASPAPVGGPVAHSAPAVGPTRPVAALPAAAPPTPPPRAVLDVATLLRDVVAEKTGYPTELLELEMTLEADLGIDSIKRVEILSAVRDRAPSLPEIDPREVGALRTLGDVVTWLDRAGLGAGSSKSMPSLVEAPTAVSAAAAAPALDVAGLLRDVVAEKTGYPTELLELGMTLEADLGIDSIKRVEILSAVRDRAPSLPEIDPREVGALRTLGDVVTWLDRAGLTGAGPAPEIRKNEPLPVADLRREVLRLVDAAPAGLSSWGLGIAGPMIVTPASSVFAAPIAAALGAAGVEAAVSDDLTETRSVLFCGGLDDVAGVDAALAVQRAAFVAARAVGSRLATGRGTFVVVYDGGGDLGLEGAGGGRAWLGGLVALGRTAAHEWPEAAVKVVDLARGAEAPAAVAARVVAELLRGGTDPEVAIDASGRRRVAVAAPTARGPAGAGLPEGSVVVVSGGARGVTAAVARALAPGRPKLLLLGRTPLVDEAAATAGVAASELLKRLLDVSRARGEAPAPKALNAQVEAIVAGREVRDTLAAVAAAGGTARYVAVDVRDAAAVAAVLAETRADWGPIRGVVHGAGVLADARIADKTDANFARVFGTKVDGLRALLDATQADPVAVLTLFSSVAARVGNPGQVDYAMANATLDAVAAVEAKRRPTCRVRSLGFGPWAGGMVGPDLAARFQARGVGLLPLEAGAAATVAEMFATDRDVAPILAVGDGLVAVSARRATARLDASLHGPLDSHRIQGVPVVPLAVAVEWLARIAPTTSSLRLRDVRVVRGIRLPAFPREGLTLDAAAVDGPHGTAVGLRDESGAVRFSAVADAGPAPLALGTMAGTAPAGLDPYGPGRLFHGPMFRALREVDAVGDAGIDAHLFGVDALGWEGAWRTDVAAVDGVLQLAMLWSQLGSGRDTLPLRVDEIVFSAGSGVADRVRLRVRSQDRERMVADADVVDAAGARVASLRGIEMYVVPNGVA